MTERQMRQLLLAEDILLELYGQLRGKRGHAVEAKRLDTILGKVNDLKYVKGPKRDASLI